MLERLCGGQLQIGEVNASHDRVVAAARTAQARPLGRVVENDASGDSYRGSHLSGPQSIVWATETPAPARLAAATPIVAPARCFL